MTLHCSPCMLWGVHTNAAILCICTVVRIYIVCSVLVRQPLSDRIGWTEGQTSVWTVVSARAARFWVRQQYGTLWPAGWQLVVPKCFGNLYWAGLLQTTVHSRDVVWCCVKLGGLVVYAPTIVMCRVVLCVAGLVLSLCLWMRRMRKTSSSHPKAM